MNACWSTTPIRISHFVSMETAFSNDESWMFLFDGEDDDVNGNEIVLPFLYLKINLSVLIINDESISWWWINIPIDNNMIDSETNEIANNILDFVNVFMMTLTLDLFLKYLFLYFLYFQNQFTDDWALRAIYLWSMSTQMPEDKQMLTLQLDFLLWKKQTNCI